MVLKIIFLLSFITTVLASTDAAKHGEKNFDNYFGPEDPRFVYDSYRDKLSFIDDEIVNQYLEGKVSDEIQDLENFFRREFYVGINCPDAAYKPKYHYLEYLGRLQVLSYLFQSLREHEYMSTKFSLKTSCQMNWNQFIKKCSPNTKEMKGFVRDSKIALKSLRPVIVSFKHTKEKELKRWINNFKSRKFESLTHYRLAHSCENKSCVENISKKLEASITRVCNEEKSIFTEVCSERDALYGVSYAPEVYHLISSSSGLRGIDEDGYGAGCLARYIEQNKTNERKVPFLKDLFSVLYEHNQSYSPDTPQGRLFAIGAVKEFNDKGLGGIFRIKKESPPKINSPVKKEVVQLNNPQFEEIVLPKFVKKKKEKVKKKVVKAVPVKKLVKRSSFLISSEFRKKFDLNEVKVNMSKFKYDYIFTLSQVKKLGPRIKDFSSIKSLKAMKKFDKLGTIKSPIPLKFIKFLIDNNHHQHLYNIINIVSDRFFIFNDIDKDQRVQDLISLKNDISTNFKWEIKILKKD